MRRHRRSRRAELVGESGRTSQSLLLVLRNPVTGLLVARDDRICREYYQYARTDRDRLISNSMTKTITGLLIGIVVSVKSVDDTPETYVPGFKGTEYGSTPIRDLLQMSSGVAELLCS